MRHQSSRRTLGAQLRLALAEGQRLALGEQVGRQQILVLSEWVETATEADEVARDQSRPLMYQLIKRVLTVGARLSPENRSGVIAHVLAGAGDVLAVALHR